MKQTMILLAAVLMIAACSKEEVDPGVISLSAAVSGGKAITRVAGTSAQLQNGQFQTDAVIHVEAYKTGAAMYSNGDYTTSDTEGTMTGSLFYPSDGSNVDICAYYPATYTSSSTEHAVQTDQTTLANYMSSDLMYATKLTNKAKGTTHNLTFYHAMAQIIVNIEPGTEDGVTAEDIATRVTAVTIKNTVPAATLTITNGDIDATKKAETAVADIAILGNKTSNIGLIVPQSVAAETPFIAVTYAGNTYTYSLPAGDAKVFAEGTKYTYTFTIKAAGLVLKSYEITDWTAGEGDTKDFII